MGQVIDKAKLLDIVTEKQRGGQKIIFTNGCFDILHAGHVRYLAAARALGDCLIIGLNSDQSVCNLKGPSRPINGEEDRAEVLCGLSAVDYVLVFDDRTAEGLVAELRPDIYVKGGDYRLEDLPEASVAAAYGGCTVLIPEVPGHSSTKIIAKIGALGGDPS